MTIMIPYTCQDSKRKMKICPKKTDFVRWMQFFEAEKRMYFGVERSGEPGHRLEL